MYRAWQIAKTPGASGGRHWVEVLFNERMDFLNTPNINKVTYALMVEDERQYKISESSSKPGTVAFNPDAQVEARFMRQGRDFVGELASVKLRW